MADEPASQIQEPEKEAEGGEGAEPRSLPVSTRVLTSGSSPPSLSLRAFGKGYAVPCFIRDTFFGVRSYEAAEIIAVETFRGGKGLAPFVFRWKARLSAGARRSSAHSSRHRSSRPRALLRCAKPAPPGWGETPYNYKTPRNASQT